MLFYRCHCGGCGRERLWCRVQKFPPPPNLDPNSKIVAVVSGRPTAVIPTEPESYPLARIHCLESAWGTISPYSACPQPSDRMSGG